MVFFRVEVALRPKNLDSKAIYSTSLLADIGAVRPVCCGNFFLSIVIRKHQLYSLRTTYYGRCFLFHFVLIFWFKMGERRILVITPPLPTTTNGAAIG